MQLWQLKLLESNARCLLSEEYPEWLSIIRVFYFVGPLILFFLSLFSLFAVSKVLKHPDGVYKNQAIQTFFLVYYFCATYIGYKIVQVYNCVDFRGEQVLEEDFSVVCSGEEYATHAVPAIMAAGLWLVAVPVLRIVMLCKNQKDVESMLKTGWSTEGLTDEETDKYFWLNTRFGVSVNGLIPSRSYWDFVTLLNQGALCFVYVGIRSSGGSDTLIMLSLLIVMVSFLILDIVAAPYLSLSLNFVKQLSQVSVMGLFIAELSVINNASYDMKIIADIFAIAPHSILYFFIAMEFRRRIYCRSSKMKKVIGIGMIYLEIDLKKQMRKPSKARYATLTAEKHGSATDRSFLKTQREDLVVAPEHVEVQIDEVDTKRGEEQY